MSKVSAEYLEGLDKVEGTEADFYAPLLYTALYLLEEKRAENTGLYGQRSTLRAQQLADITLEAYRRVQVRYEEDYPPDGGEGDL